MYADIDKLAFVSRCTTFEGRTIKKRELPLVLLYVFGSRRVLPLSRDVVLHTTCYDMQSTRVVLLRNLYKNFNQCTIYRTHSIVIVARTIHRKQQRNEFRSTR